VHIGSTLLHSPDLAFNLLKKEGADEIFSAASICLELHRIRHFNGNIRDYRSNLYIGYDATSSAVQLVGLIMGNRKLAVASNVCVDAEVEDKIHDAYMLIADSMDKAYSQCRNEENCEYLDMWMAFETKVKRAVAKPLLMTRLYGSKFLTHMDRSKEVAVEKGIINAEDTERLQGFGKAIAQLFNFAFDNEDGYNALRGYEDFVKQVAKAYAKENDKFVKWSVYEDSDAELQECTGRYEKFEGERYSCWFDGKKHVQRTYGLRIASGCDNLLDLNEKKEIDANRSASAIAPNYIHSHDALVLHKVVNRLQTSMRLTHDCFAICAGRVRDMQDAIIDTYAELFGDNNGKRLEKLRDDTYRDTGIRVELPDEYNADGITTEAIKHARYMFS
jgi:DNA-directed RNA polymerase